MDARIETTDLLDLGDEGDLLGRSGILIILAVVAAMPWLIRMYTNNTEVATSTTVADNDYAKPSEASEALAMISRPDERVAPMQLTQTPRAAKLSTPAHRLAHSTAGPTTATVTEVAEPIELNSDDSYIIPMLTVRPPADRDKCLMPMPRARPERARNSYPSTTAPTYQDWTNPQALPVLKVASPRTDNPQPRPARPKWIDPAMEPQPVEPNSLTSILPPANPPAGYPRADQSVEMENEIAEPQNANNEIAAAVVEHPIADPPSPDLPPVIETVARARPEIRPLGPAESARLNVNRQEDSLTTVESTRDRAMRLENLARSADQRTRHAFELAGRGAMFASRREFIESLRIISQGLDAEYKTVRHGRALAEGLRAIEEVDDFMPDGTMLDAELNVRRIIEGHRTEALKTADLDHMVPLTAIREYMTFAQRRLAQAMGTEAAGSMALRGLAKLYDTLSVEQPEMIKAAAAKAMAMYQAAMIVRKDNYLAANDLGVLLARSGRDAAARDVLTFAASIHRDEVVIQNLAAVNRRLGEANRAAVLTQEAAVRSAQERGARRAAGDMRDMPVTWVDQSELVGTRSSGGVAATAHPAQPAQPIAGSHPANGQNFNQPVRQPYLRQNTQPTGQRTIPATTGQPGNHWSGLPGGYGYHTTQPQTDNAAPGQTWSPAATPWYRSTNFWNGESAIN